MKKISIVRRALVHVIGRAGACCGAHCSHTKGGKA
jgi:Mb-OB3b family methanobactin precursor